MTTEEARKRYLHDPLFHTLVDMMFYGLMKQEFSLYEVRDACTFAMNMYAESRPPEPIIVPKGSTLIEDV